MRALSIRVPAALGLLLCPLLSLRRRSRLATAPPAADTGDTAWIIAATALVLFMTLPGLALFYAGLVRAKNVLSILMQCFAITGVVSLLWLARGLLAHVLRRRRRAAVHRRTRQGVHARRRARRAHGHHPRNPVLHVPDDLRHHHAGAGHRRLRRTHALLRGARIHRVVVAVRLRPAGALGVGRRLAGQARRHGFRRRHRRARERGCRPRWSARWCSAAAAAFRKPP